MQSQFLQHVCLHAFLGVSNEMAESLGILSLLVFLFCSVLFYNSLSVTSPSALQMWILSEGLWESDKQPGRQTGSQTTSNQDGKLLPFPQSGPFLLTYQTSSGQALGMSKLEQ